jgi:hypothetical protein
MAATVDAVADDPGSVASGYRFPPAGWWPGWGWRLMIAETEPSPCRTARSALTFSDHRFGQPLPEEVASGGRRSRNRQRDRHVTLDIQCLDRIYPNAYGPKLQTRAQVVAFFVRALAYSFASPALSNQIGQRFRRRWRLLPRSMRFRGRSSVRVMWARQAGTDAPAPEPASSDRGGSGVSAVLDSPMSARRTQARCSGVSPRTIGG